MDLETECKISQAVPNFLKHSYFRSSHMRCSVNIGVLRNFTKLTGKYPANIRLDEDVLKTSFVFVFRRRLEDVLIKTNMFTLALRLQKTSSRRLGQDQYIRLGHTSSRRLQDVLPRCPSCKNVSKTSSRRLEDVLIKTDMFTLALRLQKASSRRFMVTVQNFRE